MGSEAEGRYLAVTRGITPSGATAAQRPGRLLA